MQGGLQQRYMVMMTPLAKVSAQSPLCHTRAQREYPCVIGININYRWILGSSPRMTKVVKPEDDKCARRMTDSIFGSKEGKYYGSKNRRINKSD
jgi:hypothetical protein